MASPTDKASDRFYIQALLLAEVVKRILLKKAEIDLSEKPQIQLKPITEFMRRMRVTSLTKFEGLTYISTINFYESEEKLEKNSALGAIVLYIPEIHIVKLLNSLGYPVYDENEEEALEDACGSFCNLIAGNFKSGLTQLGYKELAMSHFTSYQNDVINGIPFSPDQKHCYEISFAIKGEKRMVVDLTMGRVPEEGEITEFYF